MQTFVIDLACDREYVADATRAVLSTIFFQRMFGKVVPHHKQVLGVTYPYVDYPETNALLTERCQELERALRTNTKATVILQFQDEQVKKPTWFAKTQNVGWEEWRIEVAIDPRADGASQLQRALMRVLQTAETQKDHIPPITTREVAPFPYEVTVA